MLTKLDIVEDIDNDIAGQVTWALDDLIYDGDARAIYYSPTRMQLEMLVEDAVEVAVSEPIWNQLREKIKGG